ncbi:MAG TPA: hypothetical protein VL094_08270 [Sphingomonadaceae bacterium]|nr:hypothetical protein [Sphingomonadaceae bacterium]
MSIYRRDEIFPEWEPVPWSLADEEADRQEQGFHARARSSINWYPIPFENYPDAGIFAHSKEWLTKIDASYFATFDGEELLLIDNTWFGFPDPPRWGLVSRPEGEQTSQWSHWGHFPDLPATWNVMPLTSS